MSTATAILSRADYSTINKALSAANDALDRINQAEAAGLDMAEARQQHQYVMQRLEQLKKVYFPNMQ